MERMNVSDPRRYRQLQFSWMHTSAGSARGRGNGANGGGLGKTGEDQIETDDEAQNNCEQDDANLTVLVAFES